MKTAFLALALAGLSAAAPIAAIEQDGNTFKLNDDEAAACGNEGGCLLLTRDALRTLIRQAREQCGVRT